MNRLEAAGRMVREHPEHAPTPLPEIEQRARRRAARRIVGASAAAVLTAAVVAGGLWVGSDDESAPVIADQPDATTTPTGPAGTGSLARHGVFVVEGDPSTARIVGLDGASFGTVDVGAIGDEADADDQYFLLDRGEESPAVVRRARPDGGMNQECSSYVSSIAGQIYGVCGADQRIERDENGVQQVVSGRPSGEGEGYWQHLRVSPDGAWLSAEYVGECGAPSTYFLRPDGSDVFGITGPSGASSVVGWVDGETAAVSVFGRCGVEFDGPAGVHIVRPGETPQVVVEAVEPFRAYLWQRLDDGGSAATQEARARWVALGVDDYTFEYRPQCFCGLGPTRITVVDDRVVATEPLAEGVEVSVADAPIIKQLIDEVAAAERDATGAVDVLYDDDGIPIAVSIDHIANAIDDEMAWTITNFTRS